MGDDMTLYGFPARLVLTIEGRDVDVPNAFEYQSSAVIALSNGAVMRAIMDAKKPVAPLCVNCPRCANRT